MAGHRKFDETISAWLEESASVRIPGRVLDATFERTRRTRQEIGWRAFLGRTQMPRFVVATGSVAVVVVAAVVVLSMFGRPAGQGGPASPTPAPSPSSTATVAPSPVAVTHHLWTQNGISLSVTLPDATWTGETGQGILAKNDHIYPPDGAGLIVFVERANLYVYGDPCHWSTTRPASPAATVDELISALTAQSSRDASAPIDVTVGGHAGKSITLHVPTDADFSACDPIPRTSGPSGGTHYFASWAVGPTDQTPGRYHQGPGQIDKLWILDVNGTLVVIDTGYYAGTPPAVVSELNAIVASTTFE
jgi:hypothetical protein